MSFTADERLHALYARKLNTTGFGFSCPTLPHGITKEDLKGHPSEAVLALCRLHVHQYGMRHCAEYRYWFTTEERLLKLKADDRKAKAEDRLGRMQRRARLIDIWSGILEVRTRQAGECQLHKSPAHTKKKQRLLS